MNNAPATRHGYAGIMSIVISEKVIERGTWRCIGQQVAGLSPMDIPIGGISIGAIWRNTGGTACRIGRISTENAFVIDRPPIRLLYVRPSYGGYRYAASKVFPKTRWAIDFDHALGRKMAQALAFHYVLLIRIPPSTNRGHGPYERAKLLTDHNFHKLCFPDRRIVDKWIGRPANHFRDPERLKPYRLDLCELRGLTLKQAGKFGFAMGVEDQPQPIAGLTAFWDSADAIEGASARPDARHGMSLNVRYGSKAHICVCGLCRVPYGSVPDPASFRMRGLPWCVKPAG